MCQKQRLPRPDLIPMAHSPHSTRSPQRVLRHDDAAKAPQVAQVIV